MEKLIKQIMNQIREESKEIQEPFQQSPPLINSYNQNTRPRRQRLQRNGQIWPGSEEIRGNNPYPGSKVKDKAKEIVDDNKTSSINQEIRPRRQRLQRNGNIWPGSEVIVDDVQDSVPVDSGTNNIGT